MTSPVLDAIRVSWEWLCVDPHPVTVNGSYLPGLPDRPIPLDELRARMLDRATPRPVRDAVWSHLIARSRAEGSTWTVACAGMALPMLLSVCRQVSSGFAGDRADPHSAVVTGFVVALAEIDLARPGLATSLRWAAVRAGHAAIRDVVEAPRPHDRLVHAVLTGADHGVTVEDRGGAARSGAVALRWESCPPPAGGGHPDLVLADAVAAGVLTRDEANLIGDTRLDRTSLREAAALRGRSVGALTMARLRAEMRLLDHLRPEAPTSPTTATRAATPAAAATDAGVVAPGRDVARPRHRVRRRTRPTPPGVSPSVSTGADEDARRRLGRSPSTGTPASPTVTAAARSSRDRGAAGPVSTAARARTENARRPR